MPKKQKNVNVKIECKDGIKKHGKNCGGMFYFLGFIGAAVYYIGTATTFWMGFVGFLKAIVWPAFLVYGALKSLGI